MSLSHPKQIKKATKPGRKPLFSSSMTAAERKARQRRLQDELITSAEPDSWSESDCLRVLSTKKYSQTAFHKMAWERLGQIYGY